MNIGRNDLATEFQIYSLIYKIISHGRKSLVWSWYEYELVMLEGDLAISIKMPKISILCKLAIQILFINSSKSMYMPVFMYKAIQWSIFGIAKTINGVNSSW